METKMGGNDSQKYGLTIIQGGQRRRNPRLRTAAEIALDDRMREVYARCHGRGRTRAVQEIVEGRQAPWRIPARRALEMIAAGVPRQIVKQAVAQELERWIDDLPDPPRRAA